MAVTVPRYGPEIVNWALSHEYHDVPGGHVRIYRRSALLERLRGAGLRPSGATTPMPCTRPTGGSVAWWGPRRDDHPVVKAYHRLLVWDITSAPRITRTAEHLLNPLFGKSLVVYLEKPAMNFRPPVTVAPARGGRSARRRPRWNRQRPRSPPSSATTG